MVSQVRWGLWAGVALASIAAPAAGQQEGPGSITGRVTEQGSGAPVVGAQVTVAGQTGLGATSDDSGRYVVRRVAAGRVQVQVRRVGYESATQAATVPAGSAATVDFTLARAATVLSAVTVTATGAQQSAREQGNTVAQIRLDSVPLAATPTISNVLTGRAAGVTVVASGGTTGTGSRVRIRGANSVSLSNEPLVIIDNIRVNNAATGDRATSIAVGGQEPSRLNDLKPEDIENIEILKGPAATGMFGIQAANGVIMVTTKKGARGQRPQWNFFAESGTLRDVNDYPDNVNAYGQRVGADGEVASLRNCTLERQALGSCTQVDSIQRYNPLEEKSPFRSGNRQRYGGSVGGGTELATYYLSGDWEQEKGVYPVNTLNRTNLRVNVTARPMENLDLSAQAGFLGSSIGFPQNDNNILGIIPNGVLGGTTPDTPTGGWFALDPDSIYRIDTKQDVERYTAALNGTWRPASWFTVLGTTGFDITNRDDNEVVPPATVFFADYPEGQRTRNQLTSSNYTANLNGSAYFALTPTLTSTSQAGIQFQRDYYTGTYAFGAKLLAGGGSLEGTNARFTVGERNEDNRLFGVLFQQQFGWRDKVFVSAGIRADKNSALGREFGWAAFPSAQASWVLSDESFFPQSDILSSLRLRAAFGQSGLRPQFREAKQYFAPVPVTVAGEDVPGFTIGNIGNPDLKPERTTEAEGGFDLALFRDRLNLQATYFSKTSRDALINVPLAPSLGTGPTETPGGTGSLIGQSRYENLGSVTNKGVELQLTARVLDLSQTQFDLTVNYATLANKLVELGEGIDPIVFGLGGSTQRHTPGKPLGAYYQIPYTFSDGDGDGIVTRDEMALSDSAAYLGNPLPKRSLSVMPTLSLFRWLRVTALVDYRGGYKLYNSTEEFRCQFSICPELFLEGSPLEEQAAALGINVFGTSAGYIEDASFTRLREVAATISLPDYLVQRFGGRALSLTLAGRNLGLWTDYTGFDPEVSQAGGDNWTYADFLSQPNVRYFTARLNVNF